MCVTVSVCVCNASRLNIMWNDVYMSVSKAVKNGDEENDERQ